MEEAALEPPKSANDKSRTYVSRRKVYQQLTIDPEHLVLGTYKIGHVLAHGGFGELRIGKDLENNETVAIKMEAANGSSRLALEYDLYKMIGSVDGIPKVYYYGSCDNYNALVMELLGLSLKELFQLCKYDFGLKTVCMIAVHCIRLLELVHSKNIVYRDVKPENFLIGREKRFQKRLHIIDFGLAKRYIVPETGRHIPYRFRQCIVGTIDFLSINTHLGEEQSRRDDMESLGYMLLYFIRGRLPWQNLKSTTNNKKSVGRFIQAIAELKLQFSAEELCQGLPEECAKYFRYVRELDFFEKPDYDYLCQLWLDIMYRRNWPFDNDYEWTPNLNQVSTP